MKTNIQHICTFFRASILLLLSFISLESSAHFGPRGPFGGNITCMTTKGYLAYIGTENGGVFETTNDYNNVWRARPVGLKSGKITAIVHNGSYLFAGTADSGIYIFNGYVGNDRYWKKINNGLNNLKITSLMAFEQDSQTLLAGTDGGGLYKTTDKGESWVHINNPKLNNATITCILEGEELQAGLRVYLTSKSGGFFYSDDFGQTWKEFNDKTSSTFTNTYSISYSFRTDELTVVSDKGIFTVNNPSNDTIPLFTDINKNLPLNITVNQVISDGYYWYLATDLGVYVTDVEMVNWKSENLGMEQTNVKTLAITFDYEIISGTKNKGVYKSESTDNFS